MEQGAKHERFEGERTLMRIHIGESDKWRGKPLHEAIIELFRREKFSGVTVLRGVRGYRSSSIYHTEKILRLSQDLPIVIEAVEFAERIEEILPRLDEMIGEGSSRSKEYASFCTGPRDERVRRQRRRNPKLTICRSGGRRIQMAAVPQCGFYRMPSGADSGERCFQRE
jgi:uncharacterized protein